MRAYPLNTAPFTRFILPLLVLQLAFGAAPPAAAQAPHPEPVHEAHLPAERAGEARARASEVSGRLPLRFEPNRGQADPHARFLARGAAYTLLLTPTGAVLELRKPAEAATQMSVAEPSRAREAEAVAEPARATVRMTLEGAAPAEPEGVEELACRSHYFIGTNAEKWITGVPSYARVRYREVYAGIDLVYYDRAGQLEYDFVVAAGADASAIRLTFEGADSVRVDEAGALVIETAAGALRQLAPVVYQEGAGGRQPVASRYALHGDGSVGFGLGAYDASAPLVIDPVLAYDVTMSDVLRPTGIAVDEFGNAYVVRGDVHESTLGVLKLDAAGTPVFETFLGHGNIECEAIAVDRFGNVYVTGETSPAGFPTVNAVQPEHGGGEDAFVTKLTADGSELVYSTFLGGGQEDDAFAVAVDNEGSAYVVGETDSSDFPTYAAVQAGLAGSRDAFVAKLTPEGSALAYSTYLGGTAREKGLGIAVDGAGNAYVTGYTISADFPTQNALQAVMGGPVDAFVTKLTADGSELVYSTFLGGDGSEADLDIATDQTGSAYVTGTTASTDFPTHNAFQATLAGGRDVFVTKLNPSGSALDYSTYLGGAGDEFGGNESGVEIAVNRFGSAYVTGSTRSTDFPTRSAIQTELGGSRCCFVTRLSVDGTSLVYSTYLGRDSFPKGLAVDTAGDAYIAVGANDQLRTVGSVVKLASDPEADLAVTSFNVPDSVQPGTIITYAITVTNNGPAPADAALSTAVPFGTSFVGAGASSGSVTAPAVGQRGPVRWSVGPLSPHESATVKIRVRVTASSGASIVNKARVRSATVDPLPGNNTALVTTAVQ